MKPDAVLATNTSSIRLEELRDALSDPHRLIGLHFFNPVAMMPLVEVIHTADTPDEQIDRGIAFARRIDRLPLSCLSSPGFVVNRVLMPYMMEALQVAQEGVPLPVIDKAARDFGMPMGPVELADTVGLDVAHHVAQILGQAYGFPVPDELARMVEQKKLGRKTGEGFYTWKDGKPVKAKVDQSGPPNLQDRLLLPMINEAVAVYRDGVVDDLDLLERLPQRFAAQPGLGRNVGGPELRSHVSLAKPRDVGVELVLRLADVHLLEGGRGLRAFASDHGP